MKNRIILVLSGVAIFTSVGVGALLVQTVLAAAPVAITGTVSNITTDPGGQFNPAISGNIVTYTSQRDGPPNVFYYDLAAASEHRVTAGLYGSELADVSGNSIVYTTLGPGTGDGDIYAYSIGGAYTPVAVGPTLQTSPSVSGSLVAWEAHGVGQFDIFARDIPAGLAQNLTNNSTSNSHNPNVSGRQVTYWTQNADGSCQIFVTNFDTLATRTLTSGTSCNQNPDISGNRVVYQANRDGNQDVYFFDLSTSAETRIYLPGVQQNPHISGDWISLEDLNSGASVVELYYVPTGQLFTVPSPCSSSSPSGCGSFLSDIDGQRVTFHSKASGSNQIYVYEFTVTALDQPLTITHIGAASSGLDAAAGVTFTDADPNGNLSQYSGTIDWGDTTAPTSARFAKNPFGGFAAGGTHRYASAGSYTITITINDAEGATASRTTTLRVTNKDD